MKDEKKAEAVTNQKQKYNPIQKKKLEAFLLLLLLTGEEPCEQLTHQTFHNDSDDDDDDDDDDGFWTYGMLNSSSSSASLSTYWKTKDRWAWIISEPLQSHSSDKIHCTPISSDWDNDAIIMKKKNP